MSGADVVRATMQAYDTQDRAAMESLIAADYRFTSPQDDHIDKAAFLERCFPTAARVEWQRLMHVVDLPGTDEVFLMYEYELRAEHGGGVFRNTEVSTVRDGKLVETLVFFGGRVR